MKYHFFSLKTIRKDLQTHFNKLKLEIKMNLVINLIFLTLIQYSVRGLPIEDGEQSFIRPTESYTHYIRADPNDELKYVLYSKTLTNTNEIQFELYCRTNGWAGVGLYNNDSSTVYDAAIGWVDFNGHGSLIVILYFFVAFFIK